MDSGPVGTGAAVVVTGTLVAVRTVVVLVVVAGVCVVGATVVVAAVVVGASVLVVNVVVAAVVVGATVVAAAAVVGATVVVAAVVVTGAVAGGSVVGAGGSVLVGKGASPSSATARGSASATPVISTASTDNNVVRTPRRIAGAAPRVRPGSAMATTVRKSPGALHP